MKVLIDTNVLIDYISKREPYFNSANSIMMFCSDDVLDGCIAAHSIMDAFYITRKEYTIEERKSILSRICLIVDVVGIDSVKIMNALNNNDFSDVEDCLQMECAKEFSSDYIVTRNVKDFEHSSIPAILPEDFLKLLG